MGGDLYVPGADVPTHVFGGALTAEAPQGNGTLCPRRATAVRKAAYAVPYQILGMGRNVGGRLLDLHHVRSVADFGKPLSPEYCSARLPSDGVYFCTILTYPSALFLMAEMTSL